jgi:isopropylmalate/homocitrate/citramalate synthase
VAVFASASEGFSKSNINCSIEDSLVRYHEVALSASKLSIPVRGYVFELALNTQLVLFLSHQACIAAFWSI